MSAVTAFDRAVRAIAERAVRTAGYECGDQVRDTHVAAELDDDVLIAWIAREGGYVAVLHSIADRIESQLDSDDRSVDRERALIDSLARSLPATTATLYSTVLRLCHESLRAEAEILADRLAESESEPDPGAQSDARYERERQERVDDSRRL